MMGSTDNTSQICDTYSQRDTRIKVIHQSKAGVSATRMRGFWVDSGQYLMQMMGLSIICLQKCIS